MAIDSRHFPDGQYLQMNVCIIDAGAVRINLTREFHTAKPRTFLLDNGRDRMGKAHRAEFKAD